MITYFAKKWRPETTIKTGRNLKSLTSREIIQKTTAK